MEETREKLKEKEEKALLTFLEHTREGKYVQIDESLLSYARIEIQREEAYYEDEYYYGIR